jgi:hypothetical protein
MCFDLVLTSEQLQQEGGAELIQLVPIMPSWCRCIVMNQYQFDGSKPDRTSYTVVPLGKGKLVCSQVQLKSEPCST